MTALDLAVQIALGVFLSAWVVRRDMRRLPPRLYRRSWNEASFWSAVVTFGPLCIPVHFARTRRSALGFAAGVAWMAIVFVAISLVSAGLGWIFAFVPP